MRKQWLPGYENFLKAALQAYGSAGSDGWSGAELKLSTWDFGDVMNELHLLGTWSSFLASGKRTKEGPMSESHHGSGIHVAQGMADGVRARLLCPHQELFARRANTSVVHACCQWLHTRELGTCGMEGVLGNCYDQGSSCSCGSSLERGTGHHCSTSDHGSDVERTQEMHGGRTAGERHAHSNEAWRWETAQHQRPRVQYWPRGIQRGRYSSSWMTDRWSATQKLVEKCSSDGRLQ